MHSSSMPRIPDRRLAERRLSVQIPTEWISNIKDTVAKHTDAVVHHESMPNPASFTVA